MPILPDAIMGAPPPPPSGRRYFAHGLTTTLAEAPLMQRSARAGLAPPDARASRRGPAPAPAAAPEHDEAVRQWPQHFNAETARGGGGGGAARAGGLRATARGELFPLEADALFPFGHLRRPTGGARDDAALVALRGGVGVARAGDHPYHRAEWSDGFAGAGKPPKWHADPAGPAPKLQWTAATHLGASAVAGRPLWER